MNIFEIAQFYQEVRQDARTSTGHLSGSWYSDRMARLIVLVTLQDVPGEKFSANWLRLQLVHKTLPISSVLFRLENAWAIARHKSPADAKRAEKRLKKARTALWLIEKFCQKK